MPTHFGDDLGYIAQQAQTKSTLHIESRRQECIAPPTLRTERNATPNDEHGIAATPPPPALGHPCTTAAAIPAAITAASITVVVVVCILYVQQLNDQPRLAQARQCGCPRGPGFQAKCGSVVIHAALGIRLRL
jgi:hypothetical protein